jgi:hypothetical protein
MNEKLLGLTQRRGELLARIAVQREEMAEIEAEWNAPLALADQGVAAVRFLRHHPLLVAGAMALFVIRRHSVAGLMWGVWRVWKGYRDFIFITEKT